jgi:hypothetical protein
MCGGTNYSKEISDFASIAADNNEICAYSTNNVLALFSGRPFGHWARSICDQANQERGLYRDLSRSADYHRGGQSA